MHTVHGKTFFMEFHRGQSLVRLFWSDLFYFLEGVAVASYADDTTPYTAKKTNDLVKNKINRALFRSSF